MKPTRTLILTVFVTGLRYFAVEVTMKKRLIGLLILGMLTILLSSCSLVDAVIFRQEMMEQHGEIYDLIAWCKDETGEYLIYQEQYYRRTEDDLYLDCFRSATKEDDVLISWSDGLYFYEYYADRAENPTYICTPRDGRVFVRKDYEYTEDTFSVEGTEMGFVMSEALTPTTAAVSSLYSDAVQINIYSKQCPKLSIPLRLVRKGGVWYAIGEDKITYYVLTDAFVALLEQHGVIPQDGNP